MHHTGDKQVSSSSIIIQTDFVLSCENNNNIDNDNDSDYNNEDEPEFNQLISSNRSDNVIYSGIVTKAQEFLRIVQNDKTMCKSIFTSVSQRISLIRHGEQFDINFEPCLHNGSTVSVNTNETVPAVTSSVIDPKRMNMKRSNTNIWKYSNRSNTNLSSFSNRKIL